MGTPVFINVPEQDREELNEVSGQGEGGADGEDLLSVLYTTDGGILLLVLGINVVVNLRGFLCSGTEPLEGAGKMGTADEDLGMRGSG